KSPPSSIAPFSGSATPNNLAPPPASSSPSAQNGNAQTQARPGAGYNPMIEFLDMNRIFTSYEKTQQAEAIINDHKAQAQKADEDLKAAHKSTREIRDAYISRQKQLQTEALQMRAD